MGILGSFLTSETIRPNLECQITAFTLPPFPPPKKVGALTPEEEEEEADLNHCVVSGRLRMQLRSHSLQ